MEGKWIWTRGWVYRDRLGKFFPKGVSLDAMYLYGEKERKPDAFCS